LAQELHDINFVSQQSGVSFQLHTNNNHSNTRVRQLPDNTAEA